MCRIRGKIKQFRICQSHAAIYFVRALDHLIQMIVNPCSKAHFIGGFSDMERETVRLAFTDLLETKRVPDGLRLERYLRFAFARKPVTPANRYPLPH